MCQRVIVLLFQESNHFLICLHLAPEWLCLCTIQTAEGALSMGERYWQESWSPVEAVTHFSVAWCPVPSTCCWVTPYWGEDMQCCVWLTCHTKHTLSGKHWAYLSPKARQRHWRSLSKAVQRSEKDLSHQLCSHTEAAHPALFNRATMRSGMKWAFVIDSKLSCCLSSWDVWSDISDSFQLVGEDVVEYRDVSLFCFPNSISIYGI